jgi:hypothetical protein
MGKKQPDPNAIESHSQAHADAFESLIERISKAVDRQKQNRQKLWSKVHRAYPSLSGRGRFW